MLELIMNSMNIATDKQRLTSTISIYFNCFSCDKTQC